ncbi:GWxTD domain-containing protein [Candidatus Korobacter versatilis]|nr:GWxTD domain-containing protein [Candidatus Koribacter versatilis]
MKLVRALGFVLGASCFYAAAMYGQQAPVPAEETSATPEAKASQTSQEDPLKRPLSEKQKKKQRKGLYGEISAADKKWLEEDVIYIITDEEREAFLKLSNEDEREHFIEDVWFRRDPTPDTPENEFKEEHYRRIGYANEHFASGVPGWRTDRGHIYIVFGPPDEIEAHPSGGSYERTMEEGGGETSTYPFERWRYRYIAGQSFGNEVVVEFVDQCMCGEYRMTFDPNDKDALLHVPNAGPTLMESMNMANKAERINGLNPTGGRMDYASSMSKMFDNQERYVALSKAPAIKYPDLYSEIVKHRLIPNPVPFDVRTDFVKVTSDTVLVPITIQIRNRDITFGSKDGIQRGIVNIRGQVTNMTGKIVQTFEDPVQVDVPNELLAQKVEQASVYWKALPLRSGHYRIDIAIKDVNGDRFGVWSRSISVPVYEDDKLNTSSMILADVMEKVPTKIIDAGTFVIGDDKVRPKVAGADGAQPIVFKRDQRLNVWMQVYNLGVDEKTKKASATVQYELVNAKTNKAVVTSADDTETMGNVGEQMTLRKSMALNSVEPGAYRLTVKVEDKISKQTVTRVSGFQVE